jgi:hypothetical protein
MSTTPLRCRSRPFYMSRTPLRCQHLTFLHVHEPAALPHLTFLHVHDPAALSAPHLSTCPRARCVAAPDLSTCPRPRCVVSTSPFYMSRGVLRQRNPAPDGTGRRCDKVSGVSTGRQGLARKSGRGHERGPGGAAWCYPVTLGVKRRGRAHAPEAAYRSAPPDSWLPREPREIVGAMGGEHGRMPARTRAAVDVGPRCARAVVSRPRWPGVLARRPPEGAWARLRRLSALRSGYRHCGTA